ncbi:MAG: sugar phosphate isomerase/epimerase [Saprospiraceae bacterium]|nr:sugar phosphate isomerase/epimerase [Saprospiraceae bacterium]
MTKKHILFLLVCAMALAEKLPAQKNTKPLYTANFAVQAYTYRNYFPKDAVATLDTIQKLGVTEIEGSGGRISNDDFRKLCEDRGISIPSTGASYKDLVENPMTVVEQAKTLGSKFVMCAWVPHERGNFTIEDAKRTVEDFNAAGKILKENGLTFCYHAHGYEFQPYGKGTLLDYIIENTDPEYVSFEMDVFWVHFGGGDCVKLLKKYGDRWKLIHLKDMKPGIAKDLTGGTDVEYNVPLGTGEVDIEGIIRQANKIGIKHFFIEDESSQVLSQVPQSIAYLKSLTQ